MRRLVIWILIPFALFLRAGTVNGGASDDLSADWGSDSRTIEGSGAGATGGFEHCTASDYRSLKECLSKPGRRVSVFGVVACPARETTIRIPSDTTIEGGTLEGGCGYRIESSNVVLRNTRVRGANWDCYQLRGAETFALDHVTAAGCGDGAIDIVDGSTDGTVQHALIVDVPKSILVRDGSHRLTFFRNLFVSRNTFRAPQLQLTHGIVDVRQNVILDFGPYASLNRCHGQANYVGNYYARGSRVTPPIDVRTDSGCPGVVPEVHAAENVWSDGDADAVSNHATPHPAPPVPAASACDIAPGVITEAGAQPRTPSEQTALTGITLPGCPPLIR